MHVDCAVALFMAWQGINERFPISWHCDPLHIWASSGTVPYLVFGSKPFNLASTPCMLWVPLAYTVAVLVLWRKDWLVAALQVEAASVTLEEGLQQSVEALKGAAGGIERGLEVRGSVGPTVQ